jgi:N-acetyl-gamma-glutamyl-phosphate reductase / acetylglutamate kinase
MNGKSHTNSKRQSLSSPTLLNGTHPVSTFNVRFQGITHSINIPLTKQLTSRDIRNLYQDRYAGELLVAVSGEAPLVRDISGKHGVAIGGFAVASSGNRVVVVATIDNLLKGAASQALQNINLSLVFLRYEVDG